MVFFQRFLYHLPYWALSVNLFLIICYYIYRLQRYTKNLNLANIFLKF